MAKNAKKLYNSEMAVPSFNGMDGEHLLNVLHTYCVETGASDIHVSPEKNDIRLEIRIHGVLQSLPPLVRATYEDLLRRVKFAAKLKLNITTIPQDGQYTFTVTNRVVNVRVATLPSRFGESITLRLLDPQRGIIPLQQLGFPKEMQQQLQQILDEPNGLLLVTGPTGSGKTTTLYALLSTLVGTALNIITLEDPVEYEIPHITQSEIDPEHGFTFASGLRSVLRHDPDVILVGEIRDLETAQTAIDASLTGHLVLSTLHTNSALEAIPRLLSMGVSPYTFAPALRGILAQRLVRTVTEACGKEGASCNPLDPATYGGQTVVPELVVATPAIREMILTQEPQSKIEEQVRKDGFMTMREYGEKLIKEHKTTKEEITRVAG
jgi:type II secretory ATPase GspE/PulE/Tfp pilus assembly ATPase PilB-like protein